MEEYTIIPNLKNGEISVFLKISFAGKDYGLKQSNTMVISVPVVVRIKLNFFVLTI